MFLAHTPHTHLSARAETEVVTGPGSPAGQYACPAGYRQGKERRRCILSEVATGGIGGDEATPEADPEVLVRSKVRDVAKPASTPEGCPPIGRKRCIGSRGE